MKTKILVVTLVMMLFAVQGYAQRERHDSRNRQYRTEQSYNRSGQRGRPQREYSPPRQSSSGHQHNNGYDSPAQGQRHDYGHQAPPRHEQRRPPQQYHSHHGYPPPRPNYSHNGYEPRHYHHCHFDHWRWYSWGGYHNRYICHQYYPNRFFDSLLGYYLWGALNAPTRLDIGNMSLVRSGSRLKIQIGNNVSYLNLCARQSISYVVGNTSVNISTGRGSAIIRFYDEFGNNAVYNL